MALVAGVITDGIGKFSGLRYVIDGSVGGGTLSNDPRFRAQCCVEPSRNWERSGVEMIALAFATFKQCFKVASTKSASVF